VITRSVRVYRTDSPNFDDYHDHMCAEELPSGDVIVALSNHYQVTASNVRERPLFLLIDKATATVKAARYVEADNSDQAALLYILSQGTHLFYNESTGRVETHIGFVDGNHQTGCVFAELSPTTLNIITQKRVYTAHSDTSSSGEHGSYRTLDSGHRFLCYLLSSRSSGGSTAIGFVKTTNAFHMDPSNPDTWIRIWKGLSSLPAPYAGSTQYISSTPIIFGTGDIRNVLLGSSRPILLRIDTKSATLVRTNGIYPKNLNAPSNNYFGDPATHVTANSELVFISIYSSYTYGYFPIVVKLNADGTLAWYKCLYDGTNSTIVANPEIGIGSNSNGDIFVSAISGNNNDKLTIIKLDKSSGSVLKVRRLKRSMLSPYGNPQGQVAGIFGRYRTEGIGVVQLTTIPPSQYVGAILYQLNDDLEISAENCNPFEDPGITFSTPPGISVQFDTITNVPLVIT